MEKGGFVRSFKPFSKLAWMTLVVFALSETVFQPLSFAASAPVSGMIQSVQALGGGRVEITVQGAEGETFVVTASTRIEGVLSAKEVKRGQRIVVPRAGRSASGLHGMKGMKDPFENVPEGIKKDLGLPDMPSLPEVPAVPEIPQIPKIPEIPKVPKAAAPEEMPGAGAPAGGGLPAGMGGAMPGPGPKTMGEAAPMSAPAGMPGPSASAAPSETAEEIKTVMETRETGDGIEIGFEGGEEKVVLLAEAFVKQLMNPEDLRENMNVVFTVEETHGEKVVQRLQVV